MAAEKVGELVAELGIEDLTEKQLRAAEQNMERAARRMDQIDDPRLDVDTDRVAPELDRMQRHIRTVTDDEYTVTPDVDVSHVDDGASEGEHRLRDMVGGWGSALVIAASAAGAAAGKELADQFMDWADRGANEDQLAASLGLNEWASARYGKLAGEIYADNFGDSVKDVTDAIFQGQSNSIFDFDASDEEIRKITERALTFTSIFEQDMPRTMAAVSTMLKTGMAHDAWEAFDILTTGAQNGVNKADDLLDTFIEYSTMFRSLGIDGQTALGLLSQGLQGGARDADTVADALKEFSIRGKDGSTATSEALHALGLDATDTADKLGRGGKDAADALDDVLDRLRKTEDPVERNAIAVGLFGTKAEDLQDALGKLDPSDAIKGLDDIAGAAERAQDTAGDNVAGSIESLQRKTKMAVENWVGSLWTAYDENGVTGLTDKLSDDFDKLSDWWDENGGAITDAAAEWWTEEGEPLMLEIGGFIAGTLWDGFVAMMKDKAEDVGEQIADLVVPLVDDVIDGLTITDDMAADMFKAIPNALVDALNFMIDQWNDFEIKLPSFDGLEVAGQTVIPGWEGPTLPTPNIDHLPHFATGGPVLAPMGSPVLAVIHGGEHVQTPGQKDSQDAYIDRLERKAAAGRAPAGGTTNIYTFSPERYRRDGMWKRAG